MRKQVPYRPTILCVEDEADLRKDLAEELNEAGYTVIEAANGEDALVQIGVIRPDLVLCDISMPGVGGYGVLKAIREQHPNYADIPFVFLSALADRREVVEGKRAGADDYLIKPVDFDLLLATIDARLRQIDRMRAQSNSSGAAQALDLITTGIVLIDKNRKICFANHAAREIAAKNDALRLENQIEIHGSSQNNGQRSDFKTMLDNTIAKAQKGERSLSCFAVPRIGDQRDLMLVACGMPQFTLATAHEPAAAIFITDPEKRSSPPATLLSSLFGLTPTEARIALALAYGKRPAHIAAELEIAQTTVAFHMRNIFQKTATNRQADLIALILVSPTSILLTPDLLSTV